ncbi:DUF4282 domain-containing protein [bacterium 3DAC]|nr:DUF4282 domain-containing protein [Dictyoglomota bacterium]UZN23715.1 DUF4282 domain-containing protein [bacterium 3DAC]
MFDFKFRKFITPTVVGIIYALELIGVTIGVIYFIVEGFRQSTTTGLMYLVGGIIGWFLWVVLIRVINESLVALTRIAENTSELVDLMKRNSGPPTLG